MSGLNAPLVGSQNVMAQLLSDPNSAGNLSSVLSVADARSLSGLFALVTQNAHLLLNDSGTYDIGRSASGTTGIPAISTESKKTTHNCAAAIGSFIASATDFWQIFGSGTKTVRITRLSVTGVATAATPQLLLLIKRITANSGGTATTPTISENDSNDAVATAIVKYYASGSNPTTGTTGNNVRTVYLNLGAAAGGAAGSIVWDFTTRNSKGMVLRGTGEGLVLNLNAATIASGGLLTVDCEWTEE